MRWIAILLAGVLTWTLCGCHADTQRVSTDVPEDELPQVIAGPTTAIQASIMVEGQGNAPRQRLVPEFLPPQLTPEEEAKLRGRQLVYKPLLYPLNRPHPDRPVDFFGGQETFTFGHAGAEWFVEGDRIGAVMMPVDGGQEVYADRATDKSMAYSQDREKARADSTERRPEVAADRKSEVARKYPYDPR